MKKINISEPIFGGFLLVLYDCEKEQAMKYVEKKTGTLATGFQYADGWYVAIDGDYFLGLDSELPLII